MFKSSNKDKINKLKQHSHQWQASYKRRVMTRLHQLWRSKSGSFYGIGYLVTFIILEVNSFIEEIIEFDFSLSGIVMQLLIQFLSFGLQTIINSLMAFVWPFLIFELLPEYAAIAVLVLSFIALNLIRKRWDLDELAHIKSIDRDRVKQVLDFYLFEETESGESKALQLLKGIKMTGSDSHVPSEIKQLAQSAQNKELEAWRQQPRSCLALVLLLNQQTSTEVEHKKDNSYICSILDEAIKGKLDKELEPLQRCLFYFPYLHSENKKNQQKAYKNYDRLKKKLKNKELELVKGFVHNYVN